jgi:hypothetical protein
MVGALGNIGFAALGPGKLVTQQRREATTQFRELGRHATAVAERIRGANDDQNIRKDRWISLHLAITNQE